MSRKARGRLTIMARVKQRTLTLVVTSGSFLGAWLQSLSPRTNFLGAAVCWAAGTLWFWWFICRKSDRQGALAVSVPLCCARLSSRFGIRVRI
jgi:hypothetical protein